MEPVSITSLPPDPDRSARSRVAVASLIAKVRRARTDLAEFIRLVWWNTDAYPMAPFHLEWCAALQRHRFLFLEGPRNHAKTLCATAFVTHMLGRNPNTRVKLVAANDKEARKRLYEIKQHITQNPLLKMTFPNLRPQPGGDWNKSRIVVERSVKSRDPSIESIGVMSGSLGSRADVIVLDDAVDMRNSILQPQLREQVKQKVLGELLPTLEPNGRLVVLSTPWSLVDINAILRKASGAHVISTPVGTDADPFAPIWPERWPRERLVEVFQRFGPAEYDRAYRCRALSTDTVPIQPQWIKYYDAMLLGDPSQHFCVQAYDLAISQARGADYFACVTILWDEKRNLFFVADAWQGKLTFDEQARAVVEQAIEWKPDRIVIEKGGYQGALQSYLVERAPRPLPVWPFSPRGRSKERRVVEVTPLLEQGRVFFHPNLDPQRNPQAAVRGDIVSQLLSFPLGAHDDLVDATAMAISSIRELIPSGRQDEEDGFSTDGSIQVRLSAI